jgi:hypothetical protein
MAISQDEIEREKKRLPRGWGRFGKSVERLAELSEPDETLLSSCVGLNPEFRHRHWSGHDAVALAGALSEMTKATNVVLGCTNERVIVVATGFGGAPRNDYSIPLHGLEIPSRADKEFVLSWPEGEVRIRGGHKKQVPEFLDAVAAQARPGPATAEGAADGA